MKISDVVGHECSAFRGGRSKLFGVSCPPRAEFVRCADIVPPSPQLGGHRGVDLFIQQQAHVLLELIRFHQRETRGELRLSRLFLGEALLNFVGVAAVVMESGFKLSPGEMRKSAGESL